MNTTKSRTKDALQVAVTEDELLGRDQLGAHETATMCVIPKCGGTIIENKFDQYFGNPMSRTIGPGGENQMTRVVELYCSQCGVLYHHLPKAQT